MTKLHTDAIAGKTAHQTFKNLEEENTWTLSMLFAQSSTGKYILSQIYLSRFCSCYKCIDVDYNAHDETTGFTELSYSAFFGNDGSISCSENQKTSSEHLCQCDVDYAQAIAELRTECVRSYLPKLFIYISLRHLV